MMMAIDQLSWRDHDERVVCGALGDVCVVGLFAMTTR